MLGRNLSVVGKVVLALAVLLLGAADAAAYVGPGVDVNFIGQFMTLVWFAAAASSAVLLWPVYAVLRWLRGRRFQTEAAPTVKATPSPNCPEASEKIGQPS